MFDIIKFERLESKLILYKDEFVLVDSDVAELYGVATKEINQAVSNNLDKFPDGYILELTKVEKEEVVKKFDHLGFVKVSRSVKKIKKSKEDKS